MITLEEIVAEFKRFLDGKTSLQDFESWFTSETWNIHLQDVSDQVQQIVWSLELNFAEYTSGHLSKKDLIDEASQLLFLRRPYSFSSWSMNLGPSYTFIMSPAHMESFLPDDTLPQWEFSPLDDSLISDQTSRYLAA